MGDKEQKNYISAFGLDQSRRLFLRDKRTHLTEYEKQFLADLILIDAINPEENNISFAMTVDEIKGAFFPDGNPPPNNKPPGDKCILQ